MHRDREFAKWYRKDGSDWAPMQAQQLWNAAWEAAIDSIQDVAVERLLAGQQSREVTAAEVRSAIR